MPQITAQAGAAIPQERLSQKRSLPTFVAEFSTIFAESAAEATMAHFKSPRHLRLMHIEKWAEQRFETRLQADDTAAAMRAGLFYQTISGLLYRATRSVQFGWEKY
jgi:hypothetical protein